MLLVFEGIFLVNGPFLLYVLKKVKNIYIYLHVIKKYGATAAPENDFYCISV